VSLGVVLGAAPVVAAAELLLNEVLYDPAGADAGGEFVELFNPGPGEVALDGVRLEFANGAVGPDWTVRWSGDAAATLAPGAFFLIVDSGWPDPTVGDAVVRLELQNGPDALRLVRGETVLDRLGYGSLEDAALFEGAPHPGAASGRSLGRRPDGGDTGRNDVDWVELPEPNPGAPNFRRYEARLESCVYDPPSLSCSGAAVALVARLRNAGLAALPAGRVVLADQDGEVAAAWLDELPPGQARDLLWEFTAAVRGLRELSVVLPETADGVLSLTAGAYQVGPGEVLLSEVLGAPDAGSCEWFEIGPTQRGAVDLAGWTVADADGPPRALPSRTLAPGERLVLAADAGRFEDWWERQLAAGARFPCDPGPVDAFVAELEAAWPSLNNAPPAGRDYADRLELRDPRGVIVDHVVIGAQGLEVPAGRSLERAEVEPLGDPGRNWGVATAPTGSTPGCPNSLSGEGAPEREGLDLAPNPWTGGLDGMLAMVLNFRLAQGERGWDARVFDLWGRARRDLGGDELGPGPRRIHWDGFDDGGVPCGDGAYVVLLRRFDPSGRLLARQRALAVLRRAEEW